MGRTSRRLVGMSLAVTMAMPARGAEPLRTAPYLKTCDGFLAAAESDAVEAFLMGQAQTRAERGQLLLDFGLLFTMEYRRAIKAALAKRTFGADSRRADRLAMRSILTMPGEQTRFAGEVLEELERAFGEISTAEARVLRDRVARVRAAISNDRDRAEWLKTFAAAVRATFTATGNDQRKVADIDKEIGVYFGMGGALGLVGTETNLFMHHAATFDCVMMGILGTLSGFAAGLLVKLMKTMLDDLLPDKKVPGPWRTGGRELSAASLMNDSHATLRPRPLDQIQPNDLTSQTPVQLAFAGEVELAKLKEIIGRGGALDQRDVEHDLVRLHERGEQLAKDWGDARARVRYAAAVNDLIKLIRTVEVAQTERLGTGVDLLKTLREHFERIGRVAIVATSDGLNEERVLKQELLITRRRLGLRELETIEIEEKPSLDILDVVRPLIEELKTATQPTPSTDLEWKNLVERVDAAGERVRKAFASALPKSA